MKRCLFVFKKESLYLLTVLTVNHGSSPFVYKLLFHSRILVHHIEEQSATGNEKPLFGDYLGQLLLLVHLVDTAHLAVLVVNVHVTQAVVECLVVWQLFGEQRRQAIPHGGGLRQLLIKVAVQELGVGERSRPDQRAAVLV